MQPDPAIVNALQPFVRRAVTVAFLKNAVTMSAGAAVVGQGLWLAGIGAPVVILTLASSVLVVSAAIALRRRPTLVEAARRVDRSARLQDLVVSAVSAQGDGLAGLVRRDAIATLGRQAPGAAYPLELPRRWRQFAAAALVAEAVMLGIAWQAPARRAAQSPLTSLALPSGGATAGRSQPKQADAERTRSTPDSATTPAATAAAIASGRVGLPQDKPAGVAPGAVPTETGRLRLAATNADSDIAAGRVPAARRAIVERYFAALQSQRKTPR